jgi:cytochrome c553
MLRSLLIAVALLPLPAFAEGSVEAGGKIARMCSACHGRDGNAVRANTPTIAGLDAAYIAEQLAAYRSGARVHPEMTIVAKPLADGQIADLAAWYGAQALKPE